MPGAGTLSDTAAVVRERSGLAAFRGQLAINSLAVTLKIR